MTADDFRARCLIGLNNAIERTGAATRDASDDPRIPISEALGWLFTLHEWHRIETFGNNRAALVAAADLPGNGRAFLAVVWARGMVAHARGDVAGLVVNPGASSIVGGGIVGMSIVGSGGAGGWQWAETEHLPNHQDDPRTESHYAAYVSGKSLTDPIRMAELFVRDLGS